MYGILGLLPTSGETFMSTAPLEIYLLGEIVMCSILIVQVERGCQINTIKPAG